MLIVLFKFLVLGFSIIATVVTIRTLLLEPHTFSERPCSTDDKDFIKVTDGPLERFQRAIQIETVSRGPGDYNREQLIVMQKFIKENYPMLHSSPLVKREVVANYSLLYTVTGSNPKLTPYLLMGHVDVVPVDLAKWEAPPFEGKVMDGFIYGRGTIDDKHTVFGILEAVEYLLKSGYRPKRSFFMAFGHDEEVRGQDGALAIAKLLESRNTKLHYILDEGLTIVDGIFPGANVPIALIGCSEKGWLSLRISVNATGGHSSMPVKESSIGILSNAVARLESNPQPNMFGTGPEKAMFEHIAHKMSFPLRMVLANLWLFGPIVSRALSMKPSTNAVVRTTTAITEFHSGIKDNVIPPYAWATVNHRVHPGQTKEEVIAYDREIINDERVEIEEVGYIAPHPVSPHDEDTFGFQTIKTSIRQVWGQKDAIVTPGLMIGNTDTRHYLHLTKNVYRFSPTYMYPDDLPRFHGHNERISVTNYQEAINFYYHLILNSEKEKLDPIHKHGPEL